MQVAIGFFLPADQKLFPNQTVIRMLMSVGFLHTAHERNLFRHALRCMFMQSAGQFPGSAGIAAILVDMDFRKTVAGISVAVFFHFQ